MHQYWSLFKRTFKKKFLLIFLPLGLFALPSGKNREHDLRNILHILGKAIRNEIAQFDLKGSDLNCARIQVTEFVDQYFGLIITKLAHSINHDLNPSQKKIVINLLQNLQTITATTTNDLMIMLTSIDTEEKRQKQGVLFEKYVPSRLIKRLESIKSVRDESMLAVYKEVEKIDLHDTAGNIGNRYMCQFMYLANYLFTIDKIDLSNDPEALVLQCCLTLICGKLALPASMMIDKYFFPGWKKSIEKVGFAFIVIHQQLNELLERLHE